VPFAATLSPYRLGVDGGWSCSGTVPEVSTASEQSAGLIEEQQRVRKPIRSADGPERRLEPLLDGLAGSHNGNALRTVIACLRVGRAWEPSPPDADVLGVC